MFTFWMIVLNTGFWIALHFGCGFLVTGMPERIRQKLYNPDKRFFRVTDREMRFYRIIRLPTWKDRLPQYNRDFDKRHLPKPVTRAFCAAYRAHTAQSEAVHLLIFVLGYLSVGFCLLCDDPLGNLPLFFIIATVVGVGNLPFAWIQRYNRKRLERMMMCFDRVKAA